MRHITIYKRHHLLIHTAELKRMADTSAQKKAELWIVEHFLPQQFEGMQFNEQTVRLKWGGKFAFDAVSEDKSFIGLVSTSAAKTSSGKSATAKIQKLKCDTLYLTNVSVPCRKLLVFSEQSMLEHFQKEVRAGRYPREIQLMHAQLPAEILAEVQAARLEARREVSPSRSNNSLQAQPP